ncbi:peptide ABC transporter substrate-binding protein [Candidatus Kaiserbacteria bacterium]|nr:peptide ABC transporter substrate-binding protein [Candidatus Kaiserbacteria bacterium]
MNFTDSTNQRPRPVSNGVEELLDLQKKPDIPEMQDALRKKNVADMLMEERHVGRFSALHRVLHALSPGERMLLYVLSILLAGSALMLLIKVNEQVSVTVPSRGGALSEGTLGTPRFINPLLAISQTDQDLAALIYSGLMRAGKNGTLIPDVAEGYQVSEDGTAYTFTIRENATFHDGTPIKAEDVLFTVSLAQNEMIKSPRRADWEGVSVSSPDERTVIFTLPHAYAPFLENTQLGILPKALWNNISPEEFPFHALNTNPIGSGPFKISDVTTDKAGSPILYELSAFDDFTLGRANLDKIEFHFYPNQQALKDAFAYSEIDSFAGITPPSTLIESRPDSRLVRIASTRIFGIFFNQSHAPILADLSVRSALSAAINREELIDKSLGGFGKEADGPIPPGLFSEVREETATSTETEADAARSILTKGGWKYEGATVSTTSPEASTENSVWTKGTKNKQTLSFALATADTPELSGTAESVAASWKEAGVDVDVQVYPLAEFNTTVLRPRAYDAILFGEVVGRTLDLFAFWHSSQRNDPGLNLALYASTKADKLLASARTEVNKEEREKLYREFSDIIGEDQPAVFLYAPEFIYVVPKDLEGLSFGALTSPSERFLSAHEWYTDTERVWNIFSTYPDLKFFQF